MQSEGRTRPTMTTRLQPGPDPSMATQPADVPPNEPTRRHSTCAFLWPALLEYTPKDRYVNTAITFDITDGLAVCRVSTRTPEACLPKS